MRLAKIQARAAFQFAGEAQSLADLAVVTRADGLNLVARHPERVRALVTHETPAPELLPEAERAQAVQSHIGRKGTYQREVVAGAMRKIMGKYEHG